MRMIRALCKGVCACLVTGGLLLGVAGCSSDKPNEIKTSPLPKLAHSAVQIEKIWSFRVGNGSGARFETLRPGITEQLVVAASEDGTVEAHDRRSGQRLWKVKAPAAIQVGVVAGYGIAVVGCSDGRLLAYRLKDGVLSWTASLPSSPVSLPALGSSLVYVSINDGMLFALSIKDGKKVWTAQSNVPALSLQGMATPFLVNGNVLLGTGSGRVLSFDAATGAPQWESRVVDADGQTEIERMNDVDGQMAADADSLYVASYHGGVASIDPDNGKHRWDSHTSSWQGLTVGLGSVYVSDEDSTLETFDVISGKPGWKQSGLLGRRITAPLLLNNILLVGDFDGWIHAMSVEDGHWLGRIHLYRSGGFVAPLQAYDGVIYAQSQRGRVVAIRIQMKKV